ncbi:hypothetical protein [Phyllobacterium zundukense]|uniref:Uncharacterized protein n=1 Tax=Phyllobacterium zundukense TaxID=1867719 RepID=A0ACD4CZI3_9HYPH|nr:hypothetical protein [Phyllobacterium zundukense]UXN58937.1 hypothetical protein N8E88_08530 [Phyllobacterium zundukense]
MAVGFFKTLRSSLRANLLKRVDAHIDAGTMAAMKLKFEPDTGRRYVVLNITTAGGGSTSIRAYEVDEFLEVAEKLSAAINDMRAAILSPPQD